MRNHTYAHSFFVGLSTELSPGPLLEVGVDVTSNMRTHKLRVEIPANSRQALASTLISAFRNINQLIVYASEYQHVEIQPPDYDQITDSFEFKIKFSPHEVDVAAASALIDSNGVLIIRVQRLRSWVYAHTLLTL